VESGDSALQTHISSDSESRVFAFRNVNNGRYRVMVAVDGRVWDWRDVTVSDNVVELEFRLPAPSPERFIPVRVFDPSGEPVRDASFSIGIRHERGSVGTGSPAMWQEENGTYWLPRGREPDVEPISYNITVKAPPYAPTSVEYDAGWTRVLDVHLNHAATLKLTAPNFNEHEARDQLSWSIREKDRGSMVAGSAPFARGRGEPRQESPMEFTALEPGEYDIVLTRGIGRHLQESVILKKKRVTLVEGNNHVTVNVPVLHSVVIVYPDESDRHSTEVEALDGSFRMRSGRLQWSDGRVTIDYIPAGRYLLKSRLGEMEFSVPGQDEVVFEPRRYDCYELFMTPGGRVENFGLRNGDKLIEVDGEEITDVDSGHLLVMGAFSKDSTTWVVLRDGARTSVTFSGKELYALLSDRESSVLWYVNPAMRD
jgi:hypothetical protein